MTEVTVVARARGNGSGVDRVEYGLDPSGQGGMVDGRLLLAPEGVVHVRAIDRAGNVEAPKDHRPLTPAADLQEDPARRLSLPAADPPYCAPCRARRSSPTPCS